MTLPSRSTVVSGSLLAVLGAGLAFVAPRVYRVQEAERFDIRFLPSSRPLKLLSPSLQLSVADYLWVQAVQYIGEQYVRRGRFEMLYPLVDLITDLDPGHGYAYQSAGIVLSSAGRLEESDAILKKGMEKGPNYWSFPFYLAFNDFFYRGDYESAARWAERAARTPGASANISKLALALRVKSGGEDDAVHFLEELRSQARDPKTAEALEEQYRLALLQRDFAVLDGAVERFRAERWRDPVLLEELVAAGLLDRIPPEPYGGTYVMRDGKVHSTGKDFRFPPRDPAHPPASSPLPRPSP
jgi:tetratricopeptide (TPR) repeat protein